MNVALIRLMAGFRRFHERYFAGEEGEPSVYQRLASSGQTPKTLLIGCSDSRVDPAILTGAAPGDLFVVRNVANLVPPCETSTHGFHGTSSAIEFAVVNLKVENIIVLGHRQCGGIRALMAGATEDKNSFVGQWMSIARPARERVLCTHPHANDEDQLQEQLRAAEMESIADSLRNLATFPFVAAAVAAGTLQLIGVYFDLERGELWNFDEAAGTFIPLAMGPPRAR